uniref:EF-hand domain-containing protein n=1 Tax=Sparus aurata TaxID=8175 RepID=A0A671UVC9_SPAAU
MAEDKPRPEGIVSDVHKRIKAAFEAFDYESNNTVDVREISTIIYALGCFPTQEDLHAFIAKVEEDHTGYIHLDKFLPAMTKVLLEHKFPPIPEDVLLQAFEVLDKEKKGYLEPEELTKYMTQEGKVEACQTEVFFVCLTFLVLPQKNICKHRNCCCLSLNQVSPSLRRRWMRC